MASDVSIASTSTTTTIVTDSTVVAIQGQSVSAVTPQDGYVLTWDNATQEWIGEKPPTSLPPSGTADGDLSGSYPNPTVAKIQGNAIVAQSLGSAQDGYALTWDNTDGYWKAKSVASNLIYGQAYQATNQNISTSGSTWYQVAIANFAPISANTQQNGNGVKVLIDGYVYITANIGYYLNTAGYTSIIIYQNSSAISWLPLVQGEQPAGSINLQLSVFTIAHAAANDTFYIYVQGGGTTFTIGSVCLIVTSIG